MNLTKVRRPALIAAIAVLVIVMPFVYPDGLGIGEANATL